jgi:dienelactone hydrolase
MPYALNGTLGIPEGDGPFPVVLLLHGRHPGCHFVDSMTPSPWPCPAGTETRFDQGFAYLAQALAEAGYLVLIPNMNAAYANAYGVTARNRTDLAEARSLQMLTAHLRQLRAAHQGESVNFPVPLRGIADLSQLAILGHSMGGGAAVLAARQTPASPAPGATHSPVDRARVAPKALLLVSPTPSRSAERDPNAYQLPDLPTGLIAGGCDRDIFDLSSLYYYETAAADLARRTPVAALLLPGANHNFFNAAVSQDDYYRRPDHNSLCSPQQSPLRLSRVDQETFLVDYALAFLELTLDHGKPRQPDPDWLSLPFPAPRSGELFGVPVLTNISVPNAYRQILFEVNDAEFAPNQPTIIGDVKVEPCLAFQPCDQGVHRYPQFPAALQVTWDQAGGHLRFPLSSPFPMEDVDQLRLRVATIPTQASVAPSNFAIVLRDQPGQAVRVEVPGAYPVLRQFSPDADDSGDRVLVYPSWVTIPAAQFGGIDWSSLSSVDIVFDPGTHGSLYLAQIEIVAEESKGQ